MKSSKRYQYAKGQQNCQQGNIFSGYSYPINVNGFSFITQLADDKSPSSQLTFARKKLLNTTVPLCLRAISYLRISCSILQKLDCLESENYVIELPKNPYLSLLKSLSEYKVEWWNDCEVSKSGILRSNVAVIEQLLRPLTLLHQQYLNSAI